MNKKEFKETYGRLIAENLDLISGRGPAQISHSDEGDVQLTKMVETTIRINENCFESCGKECAFLYTEFDYDNSGDCVSAQCERYNTSLDPRFKLRCKECIDEFYTEGYKIIEITNCPNCNEKTLVTEKLQTNYKSKCVNESCCFCSGKYKNLDKLRKILTTFKEMIQDL